MEQKVKKIILNRILKIPNLSTQKYKCRNFPDMFGRSSFLEKSNICTFGLTIWVSLGFRENENFLQNLVLSPCSANTSDFDNLNLPHLSLDYEKVFTCPAGPASDTVHNSKAYFVLFLDAIASLEPGQRRSVTHSRIEIRSRPYLRIQG